VLLSSPEPEASLAALALDDQPWMELLFLLASVLVETRLSLHLRVAVFRMRKPLFFRGFALLRSASGPWLELHDSLANSNGVILRDKIFFNDSGFRGIDRNIDLEYRN